MLRVNQLSVMKSGKKILKDISLSFEKGKIHGILGPNGSGKSTLLRTLAGIWEPEYGSLYWQDQNLFTMNRKERARLLSFVPQNPPQAFDFTVGEIVAMGRFPHGTPESQLHGYVTKALAQVDALPFFYRPLATLSAGERQRIYIARALAAESPILLLDEPTSSLDYRHENEMGRLLKILASQGKLILISLHHFHFAKKILDTATFLDSGTVDPQATLALLDVSGDVLL